MLVEWSIVSRLKTYMGIINFEKELGVEFVSLLDENKFDKAAAMVKKSSIKNTPDIKETMVKHIESYKYGC